ncbi:MAG: deaminase domain-containing protein [Planctomycetota bacterium]
MAARQQACIPWRRIGHTGTRSYAPVLRSPRRSQVRGWLTGRPVNLYTELKPCGSCRSVIEQFRQAFPGVKLNVTFGR